MGWGARCLAVALVVLALAGIGCGGGEPSGEAVEWSVDRPVGAKQVRLAASIEWCSEKGPVFEEPVIEYAGDRAYIELLVEPEEPAPGQTGCFLSLLIMPTTITLERDLDGLTLFDSSTDPPERRWPE